LDDDVLDEELILVESVNLSVSLGVLDQSQQELGGPLHDGTKRISLQKRKIEKDEW
jgi:hypothetical protein